MGPSPCLSGCLFRASASSHSASFGAEEPSQLNSTSRRSTVTKSGKHVNRDIKCTAPCYHRCNRIPVTQQKCYTQAKNLKCSVTVHVFADLLPGKSVTGKQKPERQCYHACDPCPITGDLRYPARRLGHMRASRHASSSLSDPSVPNSSHHFCFSRSRQVGEAPVCAPRPPIRLTMTGMAIPNLHRNRVGKS